MNSVPSECDIIPRSRSLLLSDLNSALKKKINVEEASEAKEESQASNESEKESEKEIVNQSESVTEGESETPSQPQEDEEEIVQSSSSSNGGSGSGSYKKKKKRNNSSRVESVKRAAVMKYSHKAGSEKEVTVAEGTQCSVIKQFPSGWTLVEVAGVGKGVVPTSYLEI